MIEKSHPTRLNTPSSERSLPKPAPSRKEASEILTSSLLFNQPGLTPNLRTYHPTPETMALLMDYYVCNEDILIKILYKPSGRGASFWNLSCCRHQYVDGGMSQYPWGGKKRTASKIRSCARACSRPRNTVYNTASYRLTGNDSTGCNFWD